MNEENPSIGAPQENNIAETGSITAKTARGTVHCITIVGQIEGHMELPAQNKTTKYEHLIPQITAVEQAEEIDGMLVLLNTVGGDVEAGLAIAELIAGMTKPTVSLVLGGGHSIGVPLAVAAKKSFIAASAAMTIHPVRMNGTIIAVPQAFEYLAKIQERIVDFITAHSGISAERLGQLMRETGQLTADVGTVISGKQAVTLGLIDQVGTLSDALDALYEMIAARRNSGNRPHRRHFHKNPRHVRGFLYQCGRKFRFAELSETMNVSALCAAHSLSIETVCFNRSKPKGPVTRRGLLLPDFHIVSLFSAGYFPLSF